MQNIQLEDERKYAGLASFFREMEAQLQKPVTVNISLDSNGHRLSKQERRAIVTLALAEMITGNRCGDENKLYIFLEG